MMHADPAALARALHVNLTARLWLTQAALPALQAASGTVVFALDQAQRGEQAYWGGYGLAQSAQHALMAMLRAELHNSRVQIHALCPPPMPTALRARAWGHEVAQISRPLEVAAAWLDNQYRAAQA